MINLIEGGYKFNEQKSLSYLDQPLISIITVSFNAEKHIENCIKSVISQPFQNIEHIIIDGSSQDGTISIIQKYDRELAYWRSEKDTGIYNAMNKSIKFAKGKWLLFLGADDELLNGFSEMSALLKTSNCIYYGDVLYGGKRIGSEYNTYKLAKTNICHHAIFYPRIVFDKYQYLEKYKISADHFLNIQCWVDSQLSWKYYPELISNFSSDGISSHQQDNHFEEDRLDIIKKHLGLSSYLRYLFRIFKNTLK